MEEDIHIERARKAYRAFEALAEQKLTEDAFSRGYYSLLHLAFALLLKKGEPLPKTHTGLVAKLWLSKEKLRLEKEVVKKISRFQAIRESGDYAALPAVEEKDLDEIRSVIKYFFKLLGEKP